MNHANYVDLHQLDREYFLTNTLRFEDALLKQQETYCSRNCGNGKYWYIAQLLNN